MRPRRTLDQMSRGRPASLLLAYTRPRCAEHECDLKGRDAKHHEGSSAGREYGEHRFRLQRSPQRVSPR
jgi:hypothetical protein